MLKLVGQLINIVDKSKYKKEDGLEVDVKAKLQILVEVVRANGTKVKELHTISIPDTRIMLYRDKINKEVSVDVGIISKQYSFYGV
ncbi:hypothetical protein ACMC56_03970 [Campylobacterota bacterium DY0563]